MPKKPYLESAIHHLLLQMRKIAEIERLYFPREYANWEKFIKTFTFELTKDGNVMVNWTYPKKGSYEFSIAEVSYYMRGDVKMGRDIQNKIEFKGDPIRDKNEEYFFRQGKKIAEHAGIKLYKGNNLYAYDSVSLKRYHDEENLSDSWVKSVQIDKIDVIKMNEACTAPEVRYITSRLGNLKGKKLLDIGCGLGEASVYFAIKGAKVTATDISQEMIEMTRELAKRYKVRIDTEQSSIEHLHLPKGRKFDIIYVGNLFHHVDIDKALEQISRLLQPKGMLVSWEPVHYNPIINVYRKIAVNVRSRDERPIKFSDIAKFHRYFSQIELRWFWLTTLLIFIIMVFVQQRNPNKERFWKAVVAESEKWKFIYAPFEMLDKWLFRIMPFIKPLCWNVVIIGSGVHTNKYAGDND